MVGIVLLRFLYGRLFLVDCCVPIARLVMPSLTRVMAAAAMARGSDVGFAKSKKIYTPL